MNNRGMTLIEMIAVLLLMVVVSAVVLNRFINISVVDVAAAQETVKAHLRYAQAMSMKQNNYLWGIKCDEGKYWLFRTRKQDGYVTAQTEQDTPLYLPGEEDQKLAAEGMTPFVVYYDGYGRPRYYDSGKTEPRTSVLVITIGGESIQISPETGFIS